MDSDADAAASESAASASRARLSAAAASRRSRACEHKQSSMYTETESIELPVTIMHMNGTESRIVFLLMTDAVQSY